MPVNRLPQTWDTFYIGHDCRDVNPAIELIESETNPQKREALMIAYQWAKTRIADGKEVTRESFMARARMERKYEYLRDSRDEIWEELKGLIN